MGVTVQPRTGREIDVKELGLIPRRYRQTTAGVIPEDWNVARIGDVASIKTGAKNTQDKQGNGEYPFFVRSQEIERINSYSYDGEAVLTAGDGVGTGKVFHYISGRFDVHQRVYRIADFCDAVDGRYFFYQFSTRFYNRIMSMTAKSSVDSVRLEMISDMRIPMPTPREQRAIAKALSDVDELIGQMDVLVAKKQDIKLSAMQRLLTGEARLPGFGDPWETKRMGETLSFLATASHPRAATSEYGQTVYMHYGDVHSQRRPLLDLDRTRLPRIDPNLVKNIPDVQDGDLVMVDASEDLEGVGKSVEVHRVGNQSVVAGLHTILCRSDPNHWAIGFKAYLQFYPTFKSALVRAATGTSVYGITKQQLANVVIPVPSLSEQRAIADILTDMDAEIVALEERRDKTSAIKQGMMQELLTGRTRLV